MTHVAQWKTVLAKPIKKVMKTSNDNTTAAAQVTIVDIFETQGSNNEVNIAELLISRGLAQPALDENGHSNSSNGST